MATLDEEMRKQRQRTMVFDNASPTGQILRRPSTVSAAPPQAPPLAAMARNTPDKPVTARGRGYEFQGNAGDAQRFMAAVPRDTPEARNNRARAQQQFLGRQGFRRVDPNAPEPAKPLDLLAGINTAGMGWKRKQALESNLISARAAMAQTQMAGANQLQNTRQAGADRLRESMLSGTNQLANTRLIGQNQMAVTEMGERAQDARQEKTLSATAQEREAARRQAVEDTMVKLGADMYEETGDPTLAAQVQSSTGGQIPYAKMPTRAARAKWRVQRTGTDPDGNPIYRRVDEYTGKMYPEDDLDEETAMRMLEEQEKARAGR